VPKISEARKDERRRQILDAAIDCFARRGFQDTTILDICAASGLSAGAIYSYFDGKDAIIQGIAEYGRQLAQQRAGGPDSPDGLQAFLAEFERPGDAKINQFDLRSWAEAIGNPQLRDIYLRSREETIAALAHLVHAQAKVRGIAPDVLAELILAVIVGCETRRAIQPSADVMPVIEALLTLLATPS
jgi:AcrR family transcriptional regulator